MVSTQSGHYGRGSADFVWGEIVSLLDITISIVQEFSNMGSFTMQLVALLTSFSLSGEAVPTSQIWEICVSDSDCGTFAICAYDGSNGAVKRCVCVHGYVLIPNGNCARIVHSEADPDCRTCESNGGICYDATGNGFGDGCVCPSYTSGGGCTTSHVSVTCDVSSFTMRVCYTPQSTYSGVIPVMIADGKGVDMACVGVIATSNDAICSADQYKLILPLGDHARGRCGTRKISSDITTTRYENKILIQRYLHNHQADDVSFKASCSFDSHANARFDPIGLAVHKMDESGIHHKPTLNLHVKNQLGYSIPDGVALSLGDKIRFKLVLVDDGSYGAIRIDRCIASSSPLTSDRIAMTLPLVLASCPAPGQNHITLSNNWHRITNKVNQLQTGLISMFKLSKGRSVHIHCSVKLCMKGLESQCAPWICAGNLRQRRAVHQRRSTLYSISRSLLWYEKQERKATTGSNKAVSSVSIAAVVGIQAVIFIIFMAMVVSLVSRLRKSKQVTLNPTRYQNGRV